MRKALRRAAHALMAASALGLSRPAIAQPVAPPDASAVMPPADTARDGYGRLEQMKVEMAWLADATTFPFPLAARVSEGTLEIRGFVPNETMQARVIAIAREHTRLPIVNTLQINRKLLPPETGVPTEAVRQGAVEVLNATFGMTARGFEIRAEPEGLVTIGGSVNSVEEKLAVSRLMHKVRGCTSVANYLQISPVMRDGRMVTQINASGTLVVPGQVLCLDGTGQEPNNTQPLAPVKPAPIVLPPTPAKVSALTVTPYPPTKVSSVPAPAPVVLVAPPVLSPRPAPQSMPPAPVVLTASTSTDGTLPLPPVPVPPLPVATGKTDNTPPPLPRVVTPLPVTTQYNSSTPMPSSGVWKAKAPEVDLLAVPTVPQTWATNAPPPVPTAKQKANAPTNFATARQEPPHTMTVDELLRLPAIPIDGQGQTKSSTTVTPSPSSSAPAKVVTPVQPPVKIATPVVQAPPPVLQTPASPPKELKPYPVPPAPPFRETWVDAIPSAKPTFTPDHPAPPPGGWPTAHMSGPAPTAYVSSGIVVFPDEPASAAKPAAPAPYAQPVLIPTASKIPPAPGPIQPVSVHTELPSVMKLKQRVEKACGRLASQVEVTSTEKGMTVRIKCADSDNARKATERMLKQVSEMNDERIKLEVLVGK